MKITLNTSIPEGRRPEVETLVNDYLQSPEITWQPSRFPRFVMLIEPGFDASNEPPRDSIFDSPDPESVSLSSMTETLEARIKACLATIPAS